MRTRTFDVAALLREPDPWSMPLELIQEWDSEELHLTPEERNLFLVDAYLRETRHGGHEYWFGTPYADEAADTVIALHELGFTEHAHICRKAFVVWPDGIVPIEHDEREEVIVEEWLGDDPNEVMPRLNELDSAMYEVDERTDDAALQYAWICAHPAAFGITDDEALPFEEVMARVRATRETIRTDVAAEVAADDTAAEEDDAPVPASDTFRLKPSASLWTLLAGAVLCALSVGLLGTVPSIVGGLLFGGGLATMAMAWVRYRYRLHMGPEGIRVPRRPTIPWGTVTGCQIHRLGAAGGFEIECTGPTGVVQRVFVSRALARYPQAFRMFLELAVRHDAPWGLSESFQALREAGD